MWGTDLRQGGDKLGVLQPSGQKMLVRCRSTVSKRGDRNEKTYIFGRGSRQVLVTKTELGGNIEEGIYNL